MAWVRGMRQKGETAEDIMQWIYALKMIHHKIVVEDC